MCLVVERSTDLPIGICGLLKREHLEHPDIGFAFVPESWSRGYAAESASAVMSWGRESAGVDRILAITQPDNVRSIRTLERLGLRFERTIKPPDEDGELKVFTTSNRLLGSRDLEPSR